MTKEKFFGGVAIEAVKGALTFAICNAINNKTLESLAVTYGILTLGELLLFSFVSNRFKSTRISALEAELELQTQRTERAATSSIKNRRNADVYRNIATEKAAHLLQAKGYVYGKNGPPPEFFDN